MNEFAGVAPVVLGELTDTEQRIVSYLTNSRLPRVETTQRRVVEPAGRECSARFGR